MSAHGLDNVDSWRGPTASQAAGLTLAAARAIIAAVQAEGRAMAIAPLERGGVLVGAVGVSGGDSAQDQRAVEAGVRAFAAA